jgi:hypothetical protein
LATKAATPSAALGQKLHHVPVASSTTTFSRGTCCEKINPAATKTAKKVRIILFIFVDFKICFTLKKANVIIKIPYITKFIFKKNPGKISGI